jgi:hypothetical protein
VTLGVTEPSATATPAVVVVIIVATARRGAA